MNFRGCSEEINRKVYFYHAGATGDLETVINHVYQNYSFSNIYLLGFSLGGNMILKFLGEKGDKVPKKITKAVCFSVPLDLYGSCLKISGGIHQLYSLRFLSMLKKKVLSKSRHFPDYFDLKALRNTHNLLDFDDKFTAPLHGFKGVKDYYHQCSSINYLAEVSVPTLIVNAKNDPFLSDTCYPAESLQDHGFLELLVPAQGGHCGFADRYYKQSYWSERLVWNYFNHQ